MSNENVTSNRADSLFTPAITPKVSAGDVFRFVIASILVFGGFYLMGLTFSLPTEWHILTFSAGIIIDAIGFVIAFGLNPSSELKQTAV